MQLGFCWAKRTWLQLERLPPPPASCMSWLAVVEAPNTHRHTHTYAHTHTQTHRHRHKHTQGWAGRFFIFSHTYSLAGSLIPWRQKGAMYFYQVQFLQHTVADTFPPTRRMPWRLLPCQHACGRRGGWSRRRRVIVLQKRMDFYRSF
jgi:hypothetical protein